MAPIDICNPALPPLHVAILHAWLERFGHSPRELITEMQRVSGCEQRLILEALMAAPAQQQQTIH